MAPSLEFIMQQLTQARQARARLICQMIQVDRSVQFLEQQFMAATTTRCPYCSFDSDCLPSPIPLDFEDASGAKTDPAPVVITTEVACDSGSSHMHMDVVLSVHATLAAAITGDASRYHGNRVVPLCKIRIKTSSRDKYNKIATKVVQETAHSFVGAGTDGQMMIVFVSFIGAAGVTTASTSQAQSFEAQYVETYTADAESQRLWTMLRQKCYDLCVYPQSAAGGTKQQSIAWGLLLDKNCGGDSSGGGAITKLYTM